MDSPFLVGCDFSSSPTRRKPIVLAIGSVVSGRVVLTRLERLESLQAFGDWLAAPRAWVGGFDVPFGLPRELVEHLGWPLQWRECIAHYAGLSRAEMQSDPRQATPVALQFNTRKSVDQLQGGMVLEQRLGGGQSLQFTVYTGERATQQFQAIPVATQIPPSQPGGVIDLERNYQGLDARWTNKTRWLERPLTLTAGLAADEMKEQRRGYQNFVGSTLGVQGALRRDENNKVSNFDQYLQAQWEMAERWSASAGLRHSKVSFRSRDSYVAAGNGDDSGSTSYQATTPALGLVFHASEQVNVYAALGRGFETPTLNELAYRPSGATGMNFGLDAASSRQWELGVKTQLADGVQLNAAYFRARTDDEIVVLSNTGGRSSFQNAGSTQRDGVEAVLSGQWSKSWSGLLSASWLDARYTSSFLTCVAAPCATPNTLIASGNRIPGIPQATLYGELAWQHNPWGLETALEWRYVGKIAVDDLNSDNAPAVGVFNLRASLVQAIGRWSFKEFLRVDNLADRMYSGSVIVNEGNRRFFEPAPGRTWLVGLNANYQF